MAGCQKLDGSAHCLRVPDVRRRDLRNTLCVNILKIHLLSAYQGCQDGDLAAGIVSFNVSGRVFLRITLRLRIL